MFLGCKATTAQDAAFGLQTLVAAGSIPQPMTSHTNAMKRHQTLILQARRGGKTMPPFRPPRPRPRGPGFYFLCTLAALTGTCAFWGAIFFVLFRLVAR